MNVCTCMAHACAMLAYRHAQCMLLPQCALHAYASKYNLSALHLCVSQVGIDG